MKILNKYLFFFFLIIYIYFSSVISGFCENTNNNNGNIAEKSLKEELVNECLLLCSELNSNFPDLDRINNYISLSLTIEKGRENYNYLLSELSREEKNKLEHQYTMNILNTLKKSIIMRFWLSLESKGERKKIIFESINYSDLNRMDIKRNIRTVFSHGDKVIELLWLNENGYWYIQDIRFDDLIEELFRGEKKIWIPRQKLGISIIVLGGMNNAFPYTENLFAAIPPSNLDWKYNGSYDWHIGLNVEIPVKSFFSFITGLNFASIRTSFYPKEEDIYIEESLYDISYFQLQLPVLARFQLPVKTNAFYFSLFTNLGINLKLNFNIDANYTETSYSDYPYDIISVSNTDNLRRVNMALTGSVGMEFGFGKEPHIFIGAEFVCDWNVMSTWKNLYGDSNKPVILLFNAYIKYSFYRN